MTGMFIWRIAYEWQNATGVLLTVIAVPAYQLASFSKANDVAWQIRGMSSAKECNKYMKWEPIPATVAGMYH